MIFSLFMEDGIMVNFFFWKILNFSNKKSRKPVGIRDEETDRINYPIVFIVLGDVPYHKGSLYYTHENLPVQ